MGTLKLTLLTACAWLLADVAGELPADSRANELFACVFSALAGGATTQCRLRASGPRSFWIVAADMGTSVIAGLGTFAFAGGLLDTPEKLWFGCAVNGSLGSEGFRLWAAKKLQGSTPKE